MSCYPAVVRPQMTIMDDRTLIEVVRSGCGDDVADLLQDRLADAFATKKKCERIEKYSVRIAERYYVGRKCRQRFGGYDREGGLLTFVLTLLAIFLVCALKEIFK